MPTQQDKTDALRIIGGMAELLSVPERWTQGASARSWDNHTVAYWSPIAACFCTAGAGWRCSQGFSVAAKTIVADATDGIARGIGFKNLAAWNDDPSRTHADILDLFPKVRGVIEEMEVSDAA